MASKGYAPEDESSGTQVKTFLPTATMKVMPQEEQDKAIAFWERNPEGIYVKALFGSQGGLGEVGQAISKLDTDGNGYLSRDEFRSGIKEALNAKANVKTLRYVAIFLAVAITALVGVIAGTTFALIDAAKDTEAGSDGKLTTRDGKHVIQTANSDFQVDSSAGAALTVRGKTGEPTAIGTAKASKKKPVKGIGGYFALSDAELESMDKLKIPMDGFTLHAEIIGFTKYTNPHRVSDLNTARTIVFDLNNWLHPLYVVHLVTGQEAANGDRNGIKPFEEVKARLFGRDELDGAQAYINEFQEVDPETHRARKLLQNPTTNRDITDASQYLSFDIASELSTGAKWDLSETAAACDGGVTLTSPRGQIISGWNSAENKVDYDHKSYCGWKFQRPSNSAAGDYSASTLTIYIEHFSMEPNYDRVHLGSAQFVDIKDPMRELVDSYSYKDDLKEKWESRALPDPPIVADYSGQIILTGIMELNSGQRRARRIMLFEGALDSLPAGVTLSRDYVMSTTNFKTNAESMDVTADLQEETPFQLKDYDAFTTQPITLALWVNPSSFTRMTKYPNAPYSLPMYRFYELFALTSAYKADEPACPAGLASECLGVGWAVYMNGDRLSVWTRDDTQLWVDHGTTEYAFPLNEWTHVVVVINGSESAVYINGVRDEGPATGVRGGKMDLSITNKMGNDLEIGNKEFPFDGYFDAFRFYQFAANDTTVQMIYQPPPPPPPPPLPPPPPSLNTTNTTTNATTNA